MIFYEYLWFLGYDLKKMVKNGYDFLCFFKKKYVFFNDCFMILFMIFYDFFVFSLVFMFF